MTSGTEEHFTDAADRAVNESVSSGPPPEETTAHDPFHTRTSTTIPQTTIEQMVTINTSSKFYPSLFSGIYHSFYFLANLSVFDCCIKKKTIAISQN